MKDTKRGIIIGIVIGILFEIAVIKAFTDPLTVEPGYQEITFKWEDGETYIMQTYNNEMQFITRVEKPKHLCTECAQAIAPIGE